MIKKNLKGILKDGYVLTLADIVSAILGFGSAIVFANYFTPETYGTYKFLFTILQFLTIFSLLGMGIALSRSIAMGYTGTIKTALRTRYKYTLIGSAIAVCMSAYYFFQGNANLGIGTLLIAFFLPFAESGKLYGAYLLGVKNVKLLTLAKVAVSVSAAIITWLVTLQYDSALLSFTAMAGVTILMQLWFLRITLKDQILGESDEGFLSHTKHLSAQNAFAFASGHIDKLLIWKFFGATELAVLAIVTLPVIQIKSFVKTLRGLLLVKFSQSSIKNLRKKIAVYIILLGVILTFIVVLYAAAVPFVFNTFFSQYSEYASLSQIYAIGIIALFSLPVGQIFNAHKKNKELYFLSVTHPLVKIILLFILIPQYGVLGAILSHLCAEFYSSIAATSYFYLSKQV